MQDARFCVARMGQGECIWVVPSNDIVTNRSCVRFDRHIILAHCERVWL